MKLVLASASPRRAKLLSAAGFSFEVCPVVIDESRLPGEPAATMALRLAQAKARAAIASLVARSPQQEMIVIAADTIVELDGDALGKPGSPGVARDMLRSLSGKTHHVITGVAIVRMPDGRGKCETEMTRVRLATLDTNEVDWYVATGEPLDKAGGYGIQGLGGRFVEGIEGCYFNVVGLPVRRVYRMLRELGWVDAGKV